MFEFVRHLFDSDFMPHVTCLRDSSVIKLHYFSDIVIAVAYYTIPLTLIYFVRKRRDIAFSHVFLWFGAFIFLCGTTHLMSVYTLWKPVYRMEGVVKLLTAGVSIYTAFLLWPLMPKALALPSPGQLAEANRILGIEVKERKEAEGEVRQLNVDLEQRVRERMAELTRSNRELQERTAEMEQFTYTVSHDLKSPLVTVQGFAGLIEEEVAAGRTERLAEFAREIRAAGQHMGELIGDLLELSRIGRVVNRIEPICLGLMARSVIEEHQIELKNRKINIEVQDDMPMFRADAARMRQVLDNLVVNAIKYGSDGLHPRIEIGSSQQDGMVQVFVRDNGAGVPEKYRQKIFELFQRLHPETEGTGVGLAIVKRIVELHGGRVWVESAPGAGATFLMAFPTTILSPS